MFPRVESRRCAFCPLFGHKAHRCGDQPRAAKACGGTRGPSGRPGRASLRMPTTARTQVLAACSSSAPSRARPAGRPGPPRARRGRGRRRPRCRCPPWRGGRGRRSRRRRSRPRGPATASSASASAPRSRRALARATARSARPGSSSAASRSESSSPAASSSSAREGASESKKASTLAGGRAPTNSSATAPSRKALTAGIPWTWNLAARALVGVDVDLCQHDLAGARRLGPFQRRAQRFARPAPVGPEVDHHRQLARALDHLRLEGRFGYVDRHPASLENNALVLSGTWD